MKDARALLLHSELCFSGATERLMAIGAHLRSIGIEPRVASRLGSRSDMLRTEGWSVEDVQLPRNLLLEPFAFARTRKLVKRIDPDFVIATSAEVAALAARLGRPYVLELNREPDTHIRWSVRRLKAVVVPDSTMIAAVVNRGGLPRRKICVIEHGPEAPADAVEAAASALVRGGPLRLGCSGYIDEGHGTKVVLEATKSLREGGLDVELLVFGEGPAESTLRKLARDLGIAAHTTISAPAAPKAAQLLATLDIYVSPMLERSPGWLAHLALALGLPTVFTAVSGAFELVQDGIDGRLIGRGAVNELCEAVKAFAQNPDSAREMGIRARSRWMASGRLKNFRDGWEEVLREVAPETLRISKHLS